MAQAPGLTARTGDELALIDATAQAALVRSGAASGAELVEAAIGRIQAVNGALGAVTHTLFAEARTRATQPPGEGAFAGVPFLIKGLLPMEGAPFTSGCRALAKMTAPVSPPYVEALLDAGLIVVGITNTPEFGLIETTEPALHGPTRNPWDLERTPGGSSGGAAAAVAGGMVPMAHASDGGGSIRIPAANCGVFGLKPSRGRNRFAGFPPLPHGLPDIAVDHAETRSVRDSARLLSLTEDPDTALGRLGFVDAPLRRPLRIALVREGTAGLPGAPEVDVALSEAAALCQSLGHAVEPATWPFAPAPLIQAFLDEWMVLAAGAVAQTRAVTGCAAAEPHFEPWTLELARRGAALTADRLAASVETMASASRSLTRMLERFDVLLSPVVRHPPKRLGEHATDLPYETLYERVVDNAAFTPVFNVTGMPAMSVPLCWTEGGLPIGCQFAAGLGREALLFGLAYQLEEACPWAHRWAPHSYAATQA